MLSFGVAWLLAHQQGGRDPLCPSKNAGSFGDESAAHVCFVLLVLLRRNRARERISKRMASDGDPLDHHKQANAKASRGGGIVDSEAQTLEQNVSLLTENAGEGRPSEAPSRTASEESQVWQITARHDPEVSAFLWWEVVRLLSYVLAFLYSVGACCIESAPGVQGRAHVGAGKL